MTIAARFELPRVRPVAKGIAPSLAFILITFVCSPIVICCGESVASKYKLDGSVTDASSGAGIYDAEVSVAGASSKATARTDRSGHFSVVDLSAGDYVVFTQMEGYAGPVSKIRHIHLGPEAPTAHVDYKLSRESMINGRVFSADKKPFGGLRVHVSKLLFQNGQLTLANRGESFTGENGQYEFRSLGVGKYIVDVDPSPPKLEELSERSVKKDEPVMELVQTFYPNATDASAAAPILLRAAEQQNDRDIRLNLEPTHCVSGVLDGVKGALLTLWAPIPGSLRIVTGGEIHQDKPFRICGLAEGSYKLTVGTLNTAGGTTANASYPFSLNRHNEDLGKVTPSPGVPVIGRAFIDGAKPDDPFPSGIVVALDPADGLRFVNEQLETGISDNGTFEIANLLGGTKYWVSVYHLPPEYYIRTATFDSRDARLEPISPGSGQLQIYLAKDGATINGTVLLSDGKPLSDAEVVLAPASLPGILSPGILKSAESDQNGVFHFKGVAPGNYKLIAIADLLEGEVEDASLLKPLLSDGTDVSAAANGSTSFTLTAVEAHRQR